VASFRALSFTLRLPTTIPSSRTELPGELLVRVPVRGVVLCCSNVPSGMACVDQVAARVLEKAALAGAAAVTTSWLIWTEQGWGEAEL
ncbi:MAG TPA: hypothetical protein VLT33_19025, partial [Labilithrix sp.]|nr:hypothetical protein [Labilithrix sp.]